ncbi:hypothetical protein NF868_14480 [Bacillus zhangzhouensis]|nr:hypothetical protein NF868_14480 [Bacillus zhangzhouensis]
MLLSTIFTANATAISPNSEVDEELQEVLLAIEALPDSVIAKGDESVVKWLIENSNIPLQRHSEVVTMGVVGCISTVGTAIITNVIPIAKIAKVKSAIKAAGGATKTLIPAYKAARQAGESKWNAVKAAVNKAAKNASPEAKRALLEFFNIGNVYSACFE